MIVCLFSCCSCTHTSIVLNIFYRPTSSYNRTNVQQTSNPFHCILLLHFYSKYRNFEYPFRDAPRSAGLYYRISSNSYISWHIVVLRRLLFVGFTRRSINLLSVHVFLKEIRQNRFDAWDSCFHTLFCFCFKNRELFDSSNTVFYSQWPSSNLSVSPTLCLLLIFIFRLLLSFCTWMK